MLKYLFLLVFVAKALGQCEHHPQPAHATVDCFSVGDVTTCTMTCLPGYERLAGEPTSICSPEIGGWAGPLVDCTPISAGHGNCPVITAPLNGNMSCSINHDLDVNCTFQCSNWTNLVGPSSIVCREGEWSNETPFCLTDYSKCRLDGARCEKITRDNYDPNIYLKFVPKEVRLQLQILEKSYNATMMIRGATYKCQDAMCYVSCSLLQPRKFCKTCVRCKKKKRIRCGRGGTLFG